MCKFGPACYRKNREHLESFAHPWLDDQCQEPTGSDQGSAPQVTTSIPPTAKADARLGAAYPVPQRDAPMNLEEADPSGMVASQLPHSEPPKEDPTDLGSSLASSSLRAHEAHDVPAALSVIPQPAAESGKRWGSAPTSEVSSRRVAPSDAFPDSGSSKRGNLVRVLTVSVAGVWASNVILLMVAVVRICRLN